MTAVLLFLDRSVGTRRIAGALRTADLDVETIADRYGAANTHVPDELWIAEASRDGRILLSADKRIRYRPLERSAICRNAARCLTFAAGPYVYHLTRDGLVRMNLDCSE